MGEIARAALSPLVECQDAVERVISCVGWGIRDTYTAYTSIRRARGIGFRTVQDIRDAGRIGLNIDETLGFSHIGTY